MIDIDHETYTVVPELACPMGRWGGDHTCQCVYRKTVCDGVYHLCMCGGDWKTESATQCGCRLTPREKENNPMATPVGITMTAHQGDFNVTVNISSTAAITPGSVLAVQLERAAKAMAVLLDNSRPARDNDDAPDF